jgi:hypothetical protein
MKYNLIAALYWPCWITGEALGYGWTGVIVGTIVFLGGVWLAWRIEFGTWSMK